MVSVPQPIPDTGPAELDRSALERLFRFGGAPLLDEMIRLFLAALPERLAAARAAIAGGDDASVERALHALKSSAAQLGAMRLHRLSATGEQSAREGPRSALVPLLEELDRESLRVREWLTGDGRQGLA
jgi:HPt (histidine-containing phosphotransfer) domain-containing protein